jgi:hypothetical protein
MNSTQQRAMQTVLVPGVFTVLAFFTSIVVFDQAPNRWSGSVAPAGAAGIGGLIAWAAICGRTSRPGWGQAAAAGALAGVLLHPCFWLLGAMQAGQLICISDLVRGSMLSLLVVGIITVPAGVVAGLCCRLLIGVGFATSRGSEPVEQSNGAS